MWFLFRRHLRAEFKTRPVPPAQRPITRPDEPRDGLLCELDKTLSRRAEGFFLRIRVYFRPIGDGVGIRTDSNRPSVPKIGQGVVLSAAASQVPGRNIAGPQPLISGRPSDGWVRQYVGGNRFTEPPRDLLRIPEFPNSAFPRHRAVC